MNSWIHHTSAHRAIRSRLRRIAGRTLMYPTPGHTSCRRAAVFASRGGDFLRPTLFRPTLFRPTLYGIASARNLDVHADTSDRTRPRSARRTGNGRIRASYAADTTVSFSSSYNHYAHPTRRPAQRWRMPVLRTGRVLRQQMTGTASRDGKWHTQRTCIHRNGQDMGVPNVADCIAILSRPMVR